MSAYGISGIGRNQVREQEKSRRKAAANVKGVIPSRDLLVVLDRLDQVGVATGLADLLFGVSVNIEIYATFLHYIGQGLGRRAALERFKDVVLSKRIGAVQFLHLIAAIVDGDLADRSVEALVIGVLDDLAD